MQENNINLVNFDREMETLKKKSNESSLLKNKISKL